MNTPHYTWAESPIHDQIRTMNTVQTTASQAVDLPRPVRPSITSEQRKMFRHWSEAIGGLSDADKESEAEAWIASALGILGKTNAEPIHGGKDD